MLVYVVLFTTCSNDHFPGKSPIDSSEMDMGWVHPWVGLSWVGLGEEKWTHVHL